MGDKQKPNKKGKSQGKNTRTKYSK